MKNIFKLTLIVSLLILFSCSKDFLDKFPLDKISAGNFDPDLALVGAYSTLKENEISQEMHSFDALTPINYTKFGRWNVFPKGSADTDQGRTQRLWDDLYQGLFRVNDYILRMEDYNGMSEEEKAIYIGEARFLRGYFYHRLLSSFGGVPLVLEPLGIEESRSLTRASESEILAQILEDLTFAENNLNETPRLVGTATKGAAIAFKARTHLYEHNWQEVRDEAQKVINLGVYDLYEAEVDSLKFEKVFWYENENNIEVIFDVQFGGPDSGEENAFQTYINSKANEVNPGFVRSNPTMYLVSKFERRDGLEPSDPKDFSNRDYRFYSSIIYPGAFYNTNPDGTPAMPSNLFSAGRTGLIQRKYAIENDELHLTERKGITNFILMRYADVLLMYAEAQNELSGPDASVYNAVNRVRNRAGLLDLPAGLSKEEMRERIHNERVVELAFEGLHLWDMRRWGREGTIEGTMDATQYMATYQPEGYNGERPATYQFTDPRDNFWPIPQDAIDQIPTLTQNPGW